MDVVVTVPKHIWRNWIDEGDLPGEQWSGYASHFMISSRGFPTNISTSGSDRVYIVAHDKLRGYAPLQAVERPCILDNDRSCLVRCWGAVAVTVPFPIHGFRGWRYRWWSRDEEIPFEYWEKP